MTPRLRSAALIAATTAAAAAHAVAAPALAATSARPRNHRALSSAGIPSATLAAFSVFATHPPGGVSAVSGAADDAVLRAMLRNSEAAGATRGDARVVSRSIVGGSSGYRMTATTPSLVVLAGPHGLCVGASVRASASSSGTPTVVCAPTARADRDGLGDVVKSAGGHDVVFGLVPDLDTQVDVTTSGQGVALLYPDDDIYYVSALSGVRQVLPTAGT